MAIDFSNKLIIANPTIYNLGLGITCVGLLAVITSMITLVTGDFIMPSLGWCVLGIPICVSGGIMIWSGVVKG